MKIFCVLEAIAVNCGESSLIDCQQLELVIHNFLNFLVKGQVDVF